MSERRVHKEGYAQYLEQLKSIEDEEWDNLMIDLEQKW